MLGPFVHRIDPIIGEIGGLYLWWYGLSYTLGFLGIYLWFRRARERLGFSLTEVYDITLSLAVGVLLGGRIVEIVFYEWDYYRTHLLQMPAYWLGGMATHGLLLGGTLGAFLFCWRTKKSFLKVADELVIPAAWVMGVGRLGNFIDGQIAGSVTDVWWAVQFPDLEGFRHPVVLYDGLKNLLLIPLLFWIRRMNLPRGMVFAHFLFLYASLRLFVDLFREYRVESFGLGMGQVINLGMSAVGLVLIIWLFGRSRVTSAAPPPFVVPDEAPAHTLWVRRCCLILLLAFCLVMPSDWTQDVPARYGKRHPGLSYSIYYPPVAR